MIIHPAGKLDKRLVLGTKSAAKNSYGHRIGTFTAVKTVFGSVDPLDGREFTDAQRVNAEVTHKVTIHFQRSLAITPQWMVKYGTREFDILSAIDSEEKHMKLVLLCKEIV